MNNICKMAEIIEESKIVFFFIRVNKTDEFLLTKIYKKNSPRRTRTENQ